MTAEVTVLFGAVGVVGAMLAVLVPVIRAQGSALRRELDTLRGDIRADVASLRADVAAVRAGLHALAERVARIEGAFTGPWRPLCEGGSRGFDPGGHRGADASGCRYQEGASGK